MESLLDMLRSAQAITAVGILALLLLAETAHPFFDQFRQASRTHHGARNLALGFVNGLLVAVGFAGLWVLAAEWAADADVGVLHILTDAVGLPLWAHAVGAILLLDVWMYAWHRMNHRVPFLWRFHRVHHSDPTMDVTTASRFHTGEIVLSSLLRIGVIVAFGVYAWELVLYETIAFVVVQFHHANIGLSPAVDRALRIVIPTPNMHKVHHSRWQPETDSNYGSLFSWWDRLFASFRLRDDPSTIEFGLDTFDHPEHQSLRGMLKAPIAPVSSEHDPDERAH